jgi:CHASE3 domain sensor protein
MRTDVQDPAELSVTALLKGIISDAQVLFKQQLELTRQEIKEDMQRSRDAAIVLAVAIGITMLGVGMMLVMVPLMLHWLWPDLPLWAAFAIVGGVLAAAGGALLYGAIKKFESFNPLPDKSLDALKENVQWITNPK